MHIFFFELYQTSFIYSQLYNRIATQKGTVSK